MSIRENQDISLPKGRKQTDKSLGVERAKTDQSLFEGRKQTERQSDKAVLTNRTEADEAKSQNRLDSDTSCETERAIPGVDRNSDQVRSDERLRKERQAADESLDNERRHVDTILEHERDQKETAEQKLFQSERKATDKDLTFERSQTDAEVQRAVAALTTRDEFLAIVSHDLKNPLGSISMAVELLATGSFYTEIGDETKKIFDTIARSAEEALRLIGDLLDMERIAAGKLDLQVEPHDVNKILRRSVELFALKAGSKNLSLKADTDDVAVIAMCDRDRILQVLSNLISNAIKFTPTGGVITLVARRKDKSVEISIVDTGLGIPENMHETIFGRFWQIGKHDRSGLGLGLYISKMIMEAHQGRIWVESEMGQGSTFRVTLPADLRN